MRTKDVEAVLEQLRNPDAVLERNRAAMLVEELGLLYRALELAVYVDGEADPGLGGGPVLTVSLDGVSTLDGPSIAAALIEQTEGSERPNEFGLEWQLKETEGMVEALTKELRTARQRIAELETNHVDAAVETLQPLILGTEERAFKLWQKGIRGWQIAQIISWLKLQRSRANGNG